MMASTNYAESIGNLSLGILFLFVFLGTEVYLNGKERLSQSIALYSQ
jgi:hypothetical protein